ncbi:Glyoxylase, beta-lactamase superfamily II [Paracoccus halophilus]|uniref:Glyoxylase, beta-lactamase superfamily II n=2 Tax=Paracoccus halophilus TaxID=376733 RepID=A0A1I0TYU8_9RHOB|nr:Glyoxylase, beta-lactamase superfamily II [Paracoccus halophilus]
MFFSEPEPPRGTPMQVTDRIQRLVAGNGGAMTHHGTNTYLVAVERGWVVIDPGPDDQSHLDAIMFATGGKIGRILITHDHRDHVEGAAWLARESGANLAAARASLAQGDQVDQRLSDNSVIDGFVVIATPGHAADHLCFQLGDVIFTGDHIMAWAPTSVLQPDGDARSYMESLGKLLQIRSKLFLPGHGPAIRNPRKFVGALIARTREREQALWDQIANAPADIDHIVTESYGTLSPEMRGIAHRTIGALLLKLAGDGRAVCDGARWRALQ